INSVSPLIALNGTTIKIKGAGFNLFDFNVMYNYNIVKFGTVEAEVYNSGLNEITAIVPVGLSVGTYKISLFTGVHTVIYGPDFTVPSPAITGFSPSSGIAGTYTTISGTNFGETVPAQPFTILFGSTLVEVYSWSDTSITVMIPLGTPAGSAKFTLNIAGQSVASTDSYTIVP
ncbi:MAG TPA: IPT/TIG domain-containing protein, partial [Chryseolinea sp.]|nr:IPT/TIG domain-containing protein [Chryseolinea sp.]